MRFFKLLVAFLIIIVFSTKAFALIITPLTKNLDTQNDSTEFLYALNRYGTCFHYLDTVRLEGGTAHTPPVDPPNEIIVEGDVWQVETGDKVLEISESLNSGKNRESLANITSLSYIDDSEMPSLLSKQTTSNVNGPAAYVQRMYFEDPTSGIIEYTEDEGDTTADFLTFGNNKQIARYELEFTTNLESDIDDSSGSASTTGTFLTDFEDVQLKILGKTYQILAARRTSTTGQGAILTLMGGSVRDTLVEGNTKTYTIDGKDYEVTSNFIDNDEAQFIVNGQTTRKLNRGDTDKLSDGTTIGVSKIIYQDVAGGIHSVTFFLGSQKIELRDNNILSSSGSTHELKVDDETIDGTEVVIEGTDDNVDFKLDKISINITADDDFYVPANGKLSEVLAQQDEEPEALFTESWDIEYKGLSKESTSKIAIIPTSIPAQKPCSEVSMMWRLARAKRNRSIIAKIAPKVIFKVWGSIWAKIPKIIDGSKLARRFAGDRLLSIVLVYHHAKCGIRKRSGRGYKGL